LKKNKRSARQVSVLKERRYGGRKRSSLLQKSPKGKKGEPPVRNQEKKTLRIERKTTKGEKKRAVKRVCLRRRRILERGEDLNQKQKRRGTFQKPGTKGESQSGGAVGKTPRKKSGPKRGGSGGRKSPWTMEKTA